MLCGSFVFVLLLSKQNVVIQDKVLQLYEICATELHTPVKYHRYDGYELFCLSLVEGSALISGS